MSIDEIIEQAIQGHASSRDAIRWAIEQEREACAKVAEEMERNRFDSVGDPRIKTFESQVAKAIRAGGEK